MTAAHVLAFVALVLAIIAVVAPNALALPLAVICLAVAVLIGAGVGAVLRR